ncbi:MAG: LysR substrate-binding domain-containing protein [Sulfobacillus sp.]
MELSDLDLLAEAVRLGSLSAAARQLAISQPTASRRLQRLEGELGSRLLERAESGVRASSDGEVALAFRQATQTARREMERRLDHGRGLSGELHVSASSAPAGGLAPRWIGRLLDRHPAVRIRLSVGDSRLVEEDVGRGRAMVGLMGRRPETSGLRHRQVAEEETVLVVGVQHRWAKAVEIDLNQVEAAAWVVREQGSGTRRMVEERLAEAGVDPGQLRVVAEAGSALAQLALIRATGEAGFVSSSVLAQAGADLAVVRLRGVRLLRPIVLVWADRTLTETAQAFLQLATEPGR